MKRTVLWAGSLLWLVVAAGGLAELAYYSHRPGTPGTAEKDWPAQSPIAWQGRWTLVMLTHPKCPCSRASIGELAKLLARVDGKLDAHVVMLRPEAFPPGWEKTDLWRSAAAIPGVTVWTDAGGVEAARFGAETSGQVYLYDPGARLRYRGGITAARGHAGDNTGSEAVMRLVQAAATENYAQHEGKVFGCALRSIDAN